MIAAILVAAAGILLANEACELSPWCARKLVHWSACRQYTDPARAEARAEELAALINARPGNVLKLATASCFAAGAVITVGRRAFAHEIPGAKPLLPSAHRLPGHSCSEVLARVYSYLDGEIDGKEFVQIREHLDECGPCLREYGLEEAVRRLVLRCVDPIADDHSHSGPSGLRRKVLTRIQVLRAELEVSSSPHGTGAQPTPKP